MKRIKNTTGSAKTWVGMEVAAGAYYTLQSTEEIRWAQNDAVLTALATGEAIMNDGSADIPGVAAGIAFLQDNLPKEVVTQYEKNDKSLKLASDCEDVNTQTGLATLLIKVPGTPGVDKRYVVGGMAWFQTPELEDRVLVHITDEDNILGQGAGAVVGSYTDDEADDEQKGWYVPLARPYIEVEAIGGYGELLSGLYIRVTGKRKTAGTGGKFFCNITWGKQDGVT